MEYLDDDVAINKYSIPLWNTRGIILHNRGCYKDSMKCFDKIIAIDPQNADAWEKKGDILCRNFNNYEEAIKCFNKVIELIPNETFGWADKAEALFRLERYDEAIENYDKAIELDPNNEEAWHEKGFTLYTLGSYEEAIKCFDMVLKINPTYINSWLNKGLSLYYLQYFDKAIECIDQTTKLNPDFAPARVFKSSILCEQNKYKEALECLGNISHEDEVLLGLYGSILYELDRFEEAIEYYKKSITINQESSIAWMSIGKAYYKLGKIQEAVNCFIKSGNDILNILIQLDNKDRDEISLYLRPVLDNDVFFRETTKTVSGNLDIYREVYIISMLIISRLHISQERFVSHYTKTETMKLMLINNSKFRLTTIHNSNDRREGLTLVDYLFGEEQINEKKEGKEENYTAFAGCFTFNHDSLSQFRFYGNEKEEEKEKPCTGVSIVFKNSFFNKKAKPFVMSLFSGNYEIGKQQTEEEKKYSLFRCIYLDPLSGFVNSLGCRDEYLYYRKHENEKEVFIDEIEGYKQYLDETLEYTRTKMKELKSKIDGLSPVIGKRLLLNLRYLTKYVGFKEEQECRIVEIMRSDDKKIDKDTDNKKNYIDYINIKNHVKEICFGPKVTKMESYQDILLKNGLSITCKKSEHPFV
jgi:tetratricopeptide (TPR) repeat protein